jgi:serine/threonine protein kinase
VSGSHRNQRGPSSFAAVTTPAGMAGVCSRCGATLVPSSTSCSRCGATQTGSSPAEHAERIRLRLQESVGDSYRLLELLGRGGMGIVFRAHETALDREVALKVLALDPVLSPEAWGRFEREARLAARLDHPHIVPIFAVGQRHTVAFYTMRLVRGGTLEDMLAGHQALAPEHVLDILRDVAKALDYAHGQGVVHRDIKPANVLIGDSGHAMVSDFGIAKALGAGDAPVGSGTGIIGSPGYMSPEQWRGEDIDARADQYALGVMAFEMLTGHRPFETVKVQDLMRLHLSADVPNLSSLRSGVTPVVDAAIRRAMAKRPSDRFASAIAFVDALAGRRPVAPTRSSIAVVVPSEGRTLGGAPTAPVQVGGSSRHSGWPALAIAVIGVAIITVAVIVLRDEHATPISDIRAEVHQQITHAPTPVPAPVAAPVVTVSSDTALAPGDTFDLNSAANVANRPVVHRRPVAVDPAIAGNQYNGLSGRDNPGYIRVVARGGAAKVRVDGQTLGFTPLVVRVDPGTHYVSLESSGDAFLPAQLTIEAVGNDTVSALFTARVARFSTDTLSAP